MCDMTLHMCDMMYSNGLHDQSVIASVIGREKNEEISPLVLKNGNNNESGIRSVLESTIYVCDMSHSYM